jgi:hypothetical protein
MHFLNAALRPWQLLEIEPELVTDTAHDARIKSMVHSSQRQPCLAPFSMYSDFAVTFVASSMLTGIDTTAMFNQPISKRPSFHCDLPSSV